MTARTRHPVGRHILTWAHRIAAAILRDRMERTRRALGGAQ